VQRSCAGDNISVHNWLANGDLVADIPFAFFQIPTSWYGFSLCRATPADAIAASASIRDDANTLK
jgi:hypothetical protein